MMLIISKNMAYASERVNLKHRQIGQESSGKQRQVEHRQGQIQQFEKAYHRKEPSRDNKNVFWIQSGRHGKTMEGLQQQVVYAHRYRESSGPMLGKNN